MSQIPHQQNRVNSHLCHLMGFLRDHAGYLQKVLSVTRLGVIILSQSRHESIIENLLLTSYVPSATRL